MYQTPTRSSALIGRCALISRPDSTVGRPGAIPASSIPTPIPAHLFDSDSDSDSSRLGYDSDSDTIFMNDSDSDSDSYSIPTAALLIL